MTALSRARRRLYWPFVAPATLIYVAFFVGPAIASIWISLHKWRGAGDEMDFTGAANYKRLLEDDAFKDSFANSLKILVICGVFIFALAFLMTIVLREMKSRKTVRALLFFPYIVSPVAIGVGLGLLLDPSGVVNGVLEPVGLNRSWLAPDHIFATILIGIIWVTTGFYVTLLMAGQERIPAYFYEDATLAGANRWRQFWHVTLPMSWDIVTVAAVLWVINSLKIFEFIYAFTGTGDSPPSEARTIPIYQFLMTTGGRNPAYALGYGCAMGVVMIALVTVLVVGLRRVMRREAVHF
ncbi:carbohydrate ABC transporter permease [Catelliglobosispora koreensis]|uniref:carbohydrate ABC transporter permease n=1 Tax=Catelliglobosispora koreensis TaxID=129052 RepID=UPI00037D6046|nr:sugar ABC transporter permease [Catelliglobosispora koreensis]